VICHLEITRLNCKAHCIDHHITEGCVGTLLNDVAKLYSGQFRDRLKEVEEQNKYLIEGIRKGQELSENIKWDEEGGVYTANQLEIIKLRKENVKAKELITKLRAKFNKYGYCDRDSLGEPLLNEILEFLKDNK